MTREEAITELNVIYERLSHTEDCENGVYSFSDGDYLEALNMAIEALEQEPKIGHWIADVDKWGDIVTTVNGYRCNKCNTFNADKDNYCPYCGAKMIEPQESEEV